MAERDRIAQALVQQAPVMWEPGLEQAPVQKFLEAINQAGAGIGIGQIGGAMARALATKSLPALQGLGEAGALFPEGAALPKDMKAAGELLNLLPESQKAYRYNEALSNWHAQNYDFPAVLKDKWAMLKHAGGS